MKKFLAAVLLLAFFVPSAFATVIYGNPKGKVTLVKYFDYQCPHCRTLTPVVEEIADKNKDVKVVSRVIPIMAPESWYVARAAIAAKYQGRKKFERYNEMLMDQRSFISAGMAIDLAKEAGLNIRQLKKDMASKKVTNEIRANVAESKKHNVHRIPVMFISKTSTPNKSKRILGDASFYAIQNTINQVR